MSYDTQALGPATKARPSLRLIGQDLQIMNPLVQRAVEAQDRQALLALAQRQKEAGADALDLNLGPAQKNQRLLAWAVETLQEHLNLPLFVASQVLDQPQILPSIAAVNSVTADPERLPWFMDQALAHKLELVVVLVRPGLIPVNAEERLLLASEVIQQAEQTGFPLDKLYLDPVFRPQPDAFGTGLSGLDAVIETIAALPLLHHRPLRSLVALSTASLFVPAAERSGFHQRLLPLLIEAGLDAVLLNCKDPQVMEKARWQPEPVPAC
jgi:cobalamin-dependent methionine synthase I